MSFLHFDATSAAAGASDQVMLLNVDCSDSDVSSAGADIEIRDDGSVWCSAGGFDIFEYYWITPQSAAPGTYEVQRSGTTGDEPSGPNDGVWTPLSSGTVSWAQGASYPQRNSCQFTVSIRKGAGPIIDSATFTLEADAS